MKFDYSQEMVDKITEGLRKRKERFDDQIWGPSFKFHISALTKCLKRAYFKAKGIEPVFDRNRLLRFTIGRSHGELLANLGIAEAEINGDGDLAGIVTHIDMLDKFPIEVKSTRMRITSKTKIPDHYIKQLAYECILSKKNIGYLAILWVISPDLSAYKVEFEGDELEKFKTEMLMKKDMLQKALQENNPESLDGTGYLWECRECEYLRPCKF